MHTTTQIHRAMMARAGAIGVHATDEATLVGQIEARFGAELGHHLIHWTPIRGVRAPDRSKWLAGRVRPYEDYLAASWDTGMANAPEAFLMGVIEQLCERLAACGGEGDVLAICTNKKAHNVSVHFVGRVTDSGLRCPDCGELSEPCPVTLIISGLDPYLSQHTVSRAVWEVCQLNRGTKTNTILILEPGTQIGGALGRETTIIEDKLPTRPLIQNEVWSTFISDVPNYRLAAIGTEEDLNNEVAGSAVADRLTGLSAPEIRDALVRSLINTGEDAKAGQTPEEGWAHFLRLLSIQKAEGLRRCAALELHEPVPMKDIGGLALLREWLAVRRLAFTPAARSANIPAPKGYVLVGVPGCLSASTPIYDPVDGTVEPVASRWARGIGFHVLAQGFNGEQVITAALPPVRYPKAQMVRLQFDGLPPMTVTLQHKFKTKTGWISASEIYEQLQRGEPVQLLTNSDAGQSTHAADGLRWSQTTPGSLDDCRSDLHCDDGPLR